MKRSLLTIPALVVCFVLAACGGNASPDPTALPDPASTEPVSAPLGETTEETSGLQAEASPVLPSTSTPLPTARSGRPTLPPSWTPTTGPTSTAVLTPTPSATQPIPPTAAVSETACLNFAVDPERTTASFRLGESPTLAWTPVEGARLYRVFVFDATETRLHEQLVEATEYTVPADVFQEVGVYGWLSEPLDPVGIQMCFGLGRELEVTR
jgi:hypothetical protein